MRQLYYIRDIYTYIQNRQNVEELTLTGQMPTARPGYKWYPVVEDGNLAVFGRIPDEETTFRICGKSAANVEISNFRTRFHVEFVELPEDSIIFPHQPPSTYSKIACPRKYKIDFTVQDITYPSETGAPTYLEEVAKRICDVCLANPNEIEFNWTDITVHNPNVLPVDFLNGVSFRSHLDGSISGEKHSPNSDIVLLRQPSWAEPIDVADARYNLSAQGRKFWKDFIFSREDLVDGAKRLFAAGVHIDKLATLKDSNELIVCEFSRNKKKNITQGVISNYISDILLAAGTACSDVHVWIHHDEFPKSERLDPDAVHIKYKEPTPTYYNGGRGDMGIDCEGNLHIQNFPTWLAIDTGITVATKYGTILSAQDRDYLDFNEAFQRYAIHYTDYQYAKVDLSKISPSGRCIHRKYCSFPIEELIDFIRTNCGGCYYQNFWGYSKEENLELHQIQMRKDILLIAHSSQQNGLYSGDDLRLPPTYCSYKKITPILKKWGVSEITENAHDYPTADDMAEISGLPYEPTALNLKEYAILRKLPTIQDPAGNIYIEKKYLTIPQLLMDFKAANTLVPGFSKLAEGFLGNEDLIKRGLCALV